MLLALSHDCIWNPFGKWIIFFVCAPFSLSFSFSLICKRVEWWEKTDSTWKKAKWTNELYSVRNVNAMIFARAAHTRCDCTQQLCFIYTQTTPPPVPMPVPWLSHTMHLLHIAILNACIRRSMLALEHIISAHFPSRQSAIVSVQFHVRRWSHCKDEKPTNRNKTETTMTIVIPIASTMLWIYDVTIRANQPTNRSGA